jgi:hypothetical protein
MSTVFVGLVLPGLAIALSTAASLGFQHALRRRRSILVGGVSSVLSASLLVVLGVTFRLMPGAEGPGSLEPGILMALCLGLALLALPVSAAVSAVVFIERRRRSNTTARPSP